jgi:UDP-N-acetylglucosamine--N-acetylmuramyl-(pentapeptide) pyrophosphoryl-undecaprenol N-acetylglucosamine transferase
VRREVVEAASDRASASPAEKGAAEPRTVLVAGGSQGARAVNAAILDALGKLEDLKEKICWIHVTGDADKIHMTEAYRTHGWKADVLAYSAQLPRLMARSDLFLGRAGGTTLAELAVLGLPAVLIPYPHHRDQQQLRNARYLEERGGARVIPQDDLSPESLRRVFEELLFVPERLSAMGRSLQGLARPDAADAVVDLAVDLSRTCRLDSVSSS